MTADQTSVDHSDETERDLEWRGVAAEQRDALSERAGIKLAARSQALLADLLRPYSWAIGLLVVAHRASTVMLADRVALLQNGTITHVGRHSDLLATVPEYRDLLSASFDAESELDELEREVAK